jgi:uncharacterized membrane protein YeaQ/YmgE (transglycosylase-associated protein family)
MYLVFALLLGVSIGTLACLPEPQPNLRQAVISISLGLFGSLVGWWTSDIIGVNQVSPVAQLFLAAVGSVAVVALYQTVISKPPPLR